MRNSSLLVLLSIYFFIPKAQSGSSPANCPSSYCSPEGPRIRFPFYLSVKPNQCGYPNFRLSCDNRNQTILTLPSSEQFIVTRINYARQSIFINDPNHCLPNRILNTINLTYSPFRPFFSKKFTFFNCSSDLTDYMLYGVVPVPCLSKNNSTNYTVVVTDNYYVPSTCKKVRSVPVPVESSVYRYNMWLDLTEDLMLTWREPGCGPCEAAGGTCGFKNGDMKHVDCFNIPNYGLSRRAKYAITMGIGVPGLLCLIGFVCYTFTSIRAEEPNHHSARHLPNPTITPQPAFFITGLDGTTINSYPKTILGESGRLPKPNDGTCSICLAEYLPKDILRTIPECNHYFHVTCIDEWLNMNATCPLCRNSPSSVLSLSTSSSP